LIFFHFQGLKKGLGWFFFNSHRRYRAPFSRDVRRQIYKPYIDELLMIEKSVSRALPVFDAKPHSRSAIPDIKHYLMSKVRTILTRSLQLLDVVTGRAFLVFRGTAY
jgi:hypothetical protein